MVWNENRGDLAREFIDSRGAECKDKVAAGKAPAGAADPAASRLFGKVRGMSLFDVFRSAKEHTPETPGALGRSLYLELMKGCLSNVIYGDPSNTRGTRRAYDARERAEGRDWPTQAHTMVGAKRLDNVQFCVEDVLRRGVRGDLMETGVWRGGTVILMRAILKAHAVYDRCVWAADSFAGLPPANAAQYPADAGSPLDRYKELACSLEQVQDNFRSYGLLDEQVKFLKGWFRDTLPGAPVQQLAVLRLDGDLYESTMDALVHLYPKLVPGGYLIVDDYGDIPACRQAVHDYRERHGITEEIQAIDWTGVYWKKLRAPER